MIISKKNKVNDGKKKVNKRNNIFKKIFLPIENNEIAFLFLSKLE